MQIITVSFPKKTVITVANTAKHVVSADLTQILLDLDAINGEVVGTTAGEKTDKIEATKLAIETAIEAAGVDIPAPTVFADYAAKITQAVTENTNAAYFKFEVATKTISGYNQVNGPKDVVIMPIKGIAPEKIAVQAFYYGGLSEVIDSLYIADSVYEIGIQACLQSGITSIRFPINALFTIIPQQCCHATGLTEVTIPTSVTNINYLAFFNAPIIKIIIGANVTIFADVNPTMGVYGAGFEALYDGNGKLAGTYEYAAGTWSKTA